MKNQKKAKPNVFDVLGYEGEELDIELYNLAKELGIIKRGFNRDAFSEKFFYLFIERNHYLIKDYRFTENLFDQEEDSESKNFPKSMKQAFLFMFKSLTNGISEQVDLDFVDDLYYLTKRSIKDEGSAQYREGSNLSCSGVSAKDISLNSVKAIFSLVNERNGEIYYELLPKKRAGTYVVGVDKFNFDLFHSIISKDEVRQTMSELLDAYYGKMSQLKEQNPTDDEKIELIGMLASDMMKLHPYYNGNGRTFCFGLLNHLLIQEGLTPCMIFNPWHIAHATPEDRFDAIKEGQLAFERCFINGEKVGKLGKPIIPLTPEVQKMSTLQEEAEKIPVITFEDIVKEVPNLLLRYLQIKTFQDFGEDVGEMKGELSEKIQELKSAGYLKVMKNIGLVSFDYDGDFSYENESDLNKCLQAAAQKASDKNFDFDSEEHDVDKAQSKLESNKKFEEKYRANLEELLHKSFSDSNGDIAFTLGEICEFIEIDCVELLNPGTEVTNHSGSRLDQEYQNQK